MQRISIVMNGHALQPSNCQGQRCSLCEPCICHGAKVLECSVPVLSSSLFTCASTRGASLFHSPRCSIEDNNAHIGFATRAEHYDWYERIRVYFREYDESHNEESHAHETHAGAHDKEQAPVPDLKTGGMWNQRRMRFLMEWAGL